MYCPQCGGQVPDGSSICPSCGTALSQTRAVTTLPPRALDGGGRIDPQAKSKVVAGLLGIFVGGFGVHRFYLGYTKLGVIQLVVSILTCGLGSLWGLVEGILIIAGSRITTDAEGRSLKS
jgi:TM2 domain-containing membrane protein YozV